MVLVKIVDRIGKNELDYKKNYLTRNCLTKMDDTRFLKLKYFICEKQSLVEKCMMRGHFWEKFGILNKEYEYHLWSGYLI